MDELTNWIITILKPAIAPFLMVTGAIAMWKRYGHLFKSPLDRRKDNSDILNQFLKISDQNSKVIQKLVDINEDQKDILKTLTDRQAHIKDKVDDIHERIVGNG